MGLAVKIVAIVAAATVSGAVAVPLGIFTDVNPLVVFAVAAATAVGVAWLLVLGGDRLRSSFLARFGGSNHAASRARRVVDRFGPVGLGLIGPVFPGVVASSISGVVIGVDARRLAVWLTVGIAGWFGVFTVAWWAVRQSLVR